MADPVIAVGLDQAEWGPPTEAETDCRIWLRALANSPLVYITGRTVGGARTLVREFFLPSPDVYMADSGASVAPGRLPADFSLLEATLQNSWDGEQAIRARLGPLTQWIEPQPWGASRRVSYVIKPGVRPTDAVSRMRERLEEHQATVLCADGVHVDVVPEGVNRASTLSRVRLWAGWHRRPLVAASAAIADAAVLANADYRILLSNACTPLRESLERRPDVFASDRRGFQGIADGVRAYLELGTDDDRENGTA